MTIICIGEKGGYFSMFNMNRKDLLLILAVLFIYLLIGYVFDIDPLKVFIFRVDSFSISFFGLILWIVTVILIRYFHRKSIEKVED